MLRTRWRRSIGNAQSWNFREPKKIVEICIKTNEVRTTLPANRRYYFLPPFTDKHFARRRVTRFFDPRLRRCLTPSSNRFGTLWGFSSGPAWVETAGRREPDRVCANDNIFLSARRLRAMSGAIVLYRNCFRRSAVAKHAVFLARYGTEQHTFELIKNT